MFFSNMVNANSGTYLRNRGKSFPLIIEGSDKVSNQTVRVNEGKLYVTNRDIGDNIFELKGDVEAIPTPVKGAGTLTYKELADTSENPIVVVATKGIKVYKDIPTYLNVLFVSDDMMIVSLVYGACEFEFEDGSFVPLQRCDDTDLDKKGIHSYFSCKDLKEMTHCKTKGGWDKTFEMVCPLLIRAKSSGDISVRCFKENAIIFNEGSIKAQEDKEARIAEAEKKAKEDKKRDDEERRLKAIEERNKQIEADHRRNIEEMAKKEAKKRNKKSKTAEVDSKDRNTGAEAFLAFLNGNK